MQRITITVSDQEFEALSAKAVREHRTLANISALIVCKYLDPHREAMRNGAKLPDGKNRKAGK